MIRRIKYALHGVVAGIKDDRSIRLHFLVALAVFILGFLISLSPLEWAVLVFTIFFVIVMEYVNSAIESFADRVHPEQHFAIKKTKDLAAAGVFLASICAFFVGILLFLPPIVKQVSGFCATNFNANR